jgi:hypothetical protein
MFSIKGFLMWLYTFAAIVSSGGVQGFSLSSSPSSEDGIISVCPATTVTLTCTASGVGSMTWRDHGEIHPFIAMDYDNEETRVVHDGPYTLNLTSIDNRIGQRADFISTLTVMVDDIASGTNISCLVFMKRDHLVINQRSRPSSPYNITVKTDGYQTDNFSIIISWESREDEVVDEYRILTNTTTQSITTTNTTVVLEGVYNIPLEIRVSAINCAGTSAEVTEEVFVAGCGPPSPPVNGSVGEWTSSRVGAQVTYSCDTHLVLVGETVATCSLPSLTWLPSSDDVTCVQPSATSTAATPTAATPSTPSVHLSSPRSSIGVIAGSVSVSLFVVGIIVVTLIVVVAVYKGRLKRCKLRSPSKDDEMFCCRESVKGC